MDRPVPAVEQLPRNEGVQRARNRLLAIAERAETERLRGVMAFSIQMTLGPTSPTAETGRLRLRAMPKRPRAETHEAQCETFAEGIDIAHQAGLLKAPRVLPPLATPNGRIANLVPMAHPVATVQQTANHPAEHAELVVPCQEECYRLEVLLARLGVTAPLYVEGVERPRLLNEKMIDCGNGNVPFTDESVELFLAEHPGALQVILTGYKTTTGQTLSFANILNHPTLPLTTERQRLAGERFDREDRDLYNKMWRNDLHISELAAWMATVERFEALKLMMDEDGADALSAPGTPLFQRATIGAAHRDNTARILRERGTEVWITEPAHVPAELLSSQLEHPYYLWAKKHMAEQKPKA